MTESGEHRAGLVALIGRPNTGKSTLLNQIAGLKIAAVSSKPQTTRVRAKAVLTAENYQMVFIDTPGMHKAHQNFNKRMVAEAREALGEADVVVLLVEANQRPGKGDRYLAEIIGKRERGRVLAVNKFDLLREEKTRFERLALYGELGEFDEIVPLSAHKNRNVDELLKAIEKHLPPAPALFGEDFLTDSSERDIVAELIRESVFELAEQEIPYATAVLIEDFDESERERIVNITASIIVERPTQKGMLIGKGGGFIKRVGTRARRGIEHLLDTRVNLQLHVKVIRNWTSDENVRRRLGL